MTSGEPKFDPSDHLSPYARSLGITAMDEVDGAPVLAVDFGTPVEGRPGFLHGGATSGLLEAAGYAALRAELGRQDRHHQLKPVNVTVQFVAAGKSGTSYAKGSILRLGRRNAHVEVTAWQDDSSRPIATAVMNILMVAPKG